MTASDHCLIGTAQCLIIIFPDRGLSRTTTKGRVRRLDLESDTAKSLHCTVRFMDDADLRPALAQALLGPWATMRAAAFDDPEDPPRRGVRLLAHDLVDESPERGDPRGRLAASEDLGPMDVRGGEIGERPPRTYSMLDPAGPSGCRRQRGMDPRAGMDRGLLVSADDMLVRPERLALPAAAA